MSDARHQGAANQWQASKQHKQQKQITKYKESDVSNRAIEADFPTPDPLMLQPPQTSPAQPRRCHQLMSMQANGCEHLKDFSSWILMKTKERFRLAEINLTSSRWGGFKFCHRQLPEQACVIFQHHIETSFARNACETETLHVEGFCGVIQTLEHGVIAQQHNHTFGTTQIYACTFLQASASSRNWQLWMGQKWRAAYTYHQQIDR